MQHVAFVSYKIVAPGLMVTRRTSRNGGFGERGWIALTNCDVFA